ncbi:MAG: arsenic resistance N-acetyltransferase ArsN2 [Leptolyngbyaceae cyanobacterium]
MQIVHRPSESRSRALLSACDLPTADLKSRHFDHFWGWGSVEDPQGVIGLELYDSVALLRSLAVAAEVRGTGVGKALVAAAEDYAQTEGVQALYLLTTTAAEFFARLGYGLADRDSAPESIKATREFSGLCPSSATFMMKQLRQS